MPKCPIWDNTLTDAEFEKLDSACMRVTELARKSDFSATACAFVRRVQRRYDKSTEVATRVAEYLEQLAGQQWMRGALAEPPHNGALAVARRTQATVMRLYRKAIRIDPRNARAWEGLAHMYDKADRFPQALSAARKAMKYGDDPCATAIAARVLMQMGRVKDGEKLARSLARTRNEFARNIRDDILKSRIWHPFD